MGGHQSNLLKLKLKAEAEAVLFFLGEVPPHHWPNNQAANSETEKVKFSCIHMID